MKLLIILLLVIPPKYSPPTSITAATTNVNITTTTWWRIFIWWWKWRFWCEHRFKFDFTVLFLYSFDRLFQPLIEPHSQFIEFTISKNFEFGIFRWKSSIQIFNRGLLVKYEWKMLKWMGYTYVYIIEGFFEPALQVNHRSENGINLFIRGK